MTREMRLRSAGMLFYIVLSVTLLLTEKGMCFANSMLTGMTNISGNTDWAGTLVAVAGLAIAVFTSDAVGWVFSSITMFLSPILDCHRPSRYFYANAWRKLTYDLKRKTIDDYERARDPQDKDAGLDERWKDYSADVFLSYFWQREPKQVAEWVSRRYTAFFVYLSSALGIFLGLVLSGFLTYRLGLGCTLCLKIAFVIAFLMMAFLGFTSLAPRTEARQMVDLWQRAAFDPDMKTVLDTIKQDLRTR